MRYIHFTCVTARPFEFSAEHLFPGPENQKALLFYLLTKWKFCIFTEQLKTVPSTSCEAALCLLSSTVEWAKYSCSLLTNTFSLLLDLLHWREKHNNLLNIQATKIKQFANDLLCTFFSIHKSIFECILFDYIQIILLWHWSCPVTSAYNKH